MTGRDNEIDKKISKILKEVVINVEPDKEEVEKARIAEKMLRERLDKLGVEYAFVGSYARNTWLKGSLEIDVFILFPEETPRENLEREGLEIGKSVLDSYEIRYAEHPYVHGTVAGVEVDVVPCYKLKSPEKIKSAVDRTPFHHEWLKERVKGREKDIRILKGFLKANNLYGAEYKVRGFSGYLCELLIIFYGSFPKLVKGATEWTRRTVIDVRNKEIRKGETFFVVDPVDERRNVAANLSLDNLARFVHLCREFLENPSIQFFRQKRVELPPDEDVLRELESRTVFAIEFTRPEIIEDNLFPQLERACRKITEFLERSNFMPLRSSFHAGEKCYLLFECQVPELSRIERRIGPPFEEVEHVKKFLKKERFYKPFIEKGRWWAYELRKHTKPEESVRDYICERWETLGKNVGEALKKEFKILKGKEILVDELKEKLVEFLGLEGDV
jgi:tRNA nucleotidyltransferase (CCA-adding enzyme)